MDHTKHNSSVRPVRGCPECDREIGRPIVRRFGDGWSSSVVPQSPAPKKDDNGKQGRD